MYPNADDDYTMRNDRVQAYAGWALMLAPFLLLTLGVLWVIVDAAT